MPYSDKLPRMNRQYRICQHLDENGERCRKSVWYQVDVHENPEHRPFMGTFWYVVELCKEHFAEREETLADTSPAPSA